MKKLVALLLAALMLATLFAGCGKTETAPDTKPAETKPAETHENVKETVAADAVSTKDKLVIGCEAEPYSLSPLESTGAPSARIRRLICEGLFEINEAGEYVPLLATEWKWEDDVTLVFYLREGVKFSDGTPFTADDVIFTLENGMNSAAGSFFTPYVDHTEKVDDYTVKIVFNQVTSMCFDKFESQHFPIYNQAAYEKDGNQFAYNLIGTGPYVLKNWTTGESLTLERNPDYWGEAPKIENVVFRFITESSQRTVELETGGIDLNVSVTADDVEYFENNSYRINEAAGQFMVELYYNMAEEVRPSPVQDVRVRQAIAYALDTDGLVATYYGGRGSAPNSNVNPAYSGVYEPGAETLYAENLEKAKELLAEAGYADGFKLICLSDDTQQYQDLTEILQASLQPLGIEVEILIRNSTTWFMTVVGKEEWDVCWFSLGDASPVFAFTHFLGDGSLGSPDYTSYHNADFQAALKQAGQENDPAKLKELFRKMNQYMIDDLPMYSVYVPVEIAVYTSSLKNFEYRHGMLNVEEMCFG